MEVKFQGHKQRKTNFDYKKSHSNTNEAMSIQKK
jgi:hypothetical protein